MCKEVEGPHYLEVTCPAQSCQRRVTLTCPYCHAGALQCDAAYIIHCPHCHHQMKEVICSCGFTIMPSYIREKQQTLKRLRDNSNPKNYQAIATTLVIFTSIIWVFSKIYEVS